MADLIAQGLSFEHRWRREFTDHAPLILGRAAEHWSVPWDDHISRRHVELTWQANSKRLQVRRLPEASNPLFFQGQSRHECQLRPGDHFVIGSTTFTLVDEPARVIANLPQPVEQQSFDAGELKQQPFLDANQRLGVLSRLPEILAGASDDTELGIRLINVLLTGLPRASAAAIVTRDVPRAGDEQFSLPDAPLTTTIQIRHWDRRGADGGEFRPSEQLIHEALEQQTSILHTWQRAAGSTSSKGNVHSTPDDWAYCTPLRGTGCRGWALYVAGRVKVSLSDRLDAPAFVSSTALLEEIRDDVKFTEIVAATFSHLRSSQALVRQQAGLSQFFSPIVLKALAGQDPEQVLAPREVDVAVLFCDLRGFSRTSARASGNLLQLLQRVSGALGVMTRHILAEGGVIGDFHGDAAMGFWGWPLQQSDAIERACRAALAIRREFTAAATIPDHPLADFRIGIGVAAGKAVAGKIGSVDQVKVTVFGPVVNLAARLESMTKILRAPILIDMPTAEVVRQRLAPHQARTRRVAVVRPAGLDAPVEVAQLLAPADEEPLLSDQHLANYERALQSFLQGNWPLAHKLLHDMPADDRVPDFLTGFIVQNDRVAPSNWEGVIPLADK